MRYILILLIIFMSSHPASAYENAFPKTDVGVIEIKTLPAARLLVSRGDGDYFSENNDLFRPLFNYIQTNNIPMTTPVEAEIDPSAMYFYVSNEHSDKLLESDPEVSVIELPERTVLSIGVRGSYNARNFNQAKETLLAHLSEMQGWTQNGAARAIYWNGPFTLGFLKHSEVHIPVKSNN